jgi:hypothetical protein
VYSLPIPAKRGLKVRHCRPNSTIFNIKAITDKLLSGFQGCKVIYQQPIWYSETTYNRSRYLKAGLARLQTYFPELKSLVAEYSVTNPGRVYMGDTKAFDNFRENFATELIPESGNAGTFYLHQNKKGAESLGRFWWEGIYQAVFSRCKGVKVQRCYRATVQGCNGTMVQRRNCTGRPADPQTI